MGSYSKDTIDKIGNAAIYMCERIPSMSKTKLLKLLYLLEEESVRMYNIPFFGIKFEIWQFGPVAKEVFVDLSDNVVVFGDYIKCSQNEEGIAIYSAKRGFSDDEFSDNDIRLMGFVVEKYGSLNASQLVKSTHGAGSLWSIMAKEEGLLAEFNAKRTNYSDVGIDFTKLLSGCEIDRYHDSKEAMDAFNSIK